MPKNRTNYANGKYQRERRANARRKGLCITCCHRKPRDGLRTCETCLASHRRAARGVKFCVRCLEFHPPKKHRVELRILRMAA
jgi:hypothetical protein